MLARWALNLPGTIGSHGKTIRPPRRFDKTVYYGTSRAPQSSKHQHPSSRETPRAKLQNPRTPCLELAVWCFSAAWRLDVGAFCAAIFHCLRRGNQNDPWLYGEPGAIIFRFIARAMRLLLMALARKSSNFFTSSGLRKVL